MVDQPLIDISTENWRIVRDILQRYVPDREVWAFGSRAKWTAKEFSDLDIAIIDPADMHYYQPGWTMVGAGVFDAATTDRKMASLIPAGVHWIKAAVAAFEPEKKSVILDGGRTVTYKKLIVAPGIKLNWGGIEGLV
jgi:NADH dehydrogenase FAD-containing subunit